MNTLDRPPEDTSEETPIQRLDDDQVRALLRQLDEDIAKWRARLSLLLNTAVQYELDKSGAKDGLEVIASVASMPSPTLSKLLAGDYRPTPKTWAQIERVLILCQASQGVERVIAARLYFRRLAELHTERNRVLNRGVELTRRKTNAERATAAGVARSGTTQENPIVASQPGATAVAKSATPTTEAEANGAEDRATPESPHTPTVIPDLRGYEQRPDPLLAKTPSMFVEAMRAYNAWAGNLSYREMERRCDKQLSYSTFRNMLNTDTLPKLTSVEIFVRVLGGSPEDLQKWATAWRQIAMDDFRKIGRERRRSKAQEVPD